MSTPTPAPESPSLSVLPPAPASEEKRQHSTSTLAQVVVDNLKQSKDPKIQSVVNGTLCASLCDCLEDAIVSEIDMLAHLNLSDVEKALLKEEIKLIFSTACNSSNRFRTWVSQLVSTCRRKPKLVSPLPPPPPPPPPSPASTEHIEEKKNS